MTQLEAALNKLGVSQADLKALLGKNGDKPKQSKAQMLASKDKRIVAAFARKGIKNVVLMDRTDPNAPFNVKPYKVWLAEGRIVRKGEHGAEGLFHVSQTDEVVAAE